MKSSSLSVGEDGPSRSFNKPARAVEVKQNPSLKKPARAVEVKKNPSLKKPARAVEVKQKKVGK